MKRVQGFSSSQSLRLDNTLDMELVSKEVNAFLAKLYELGVREEDISVSFNVTPMFIMVTPTPLERNCQTLRTETVLISVLIMWKSDELLAV